MIKKLFIIGITVIAVVAVLWYMSSSTGAASGDLQVLEEYGGEITLYKSQSCGCCGIYAKYLQDKIDTKITIVNTPNLGPIKEKYGVPSSLQSCHTMIIGDYFVEGHIPWEAVAKLMKEQPGIAGIAMPGMQSGSPGMPGAKTGDFVIYAVSKDGSYDEFMRI